MPGPRKPVRKPVRKPAIKKPVETEVRLVEEEQTEVVEVQEQEEPRKPAPLKERMKRVPIGTRRNLTTAEDLDPNYEHRWVRDKDARLQTFLDAGYEFVDAGTSGEGGIRPSNTDSRTTAPSKDSADKLYLMRIPKDYFEEDQRAKQERIDAIENDLKPSAEREGLSGKLEVSR